MKINLSNYIEDQIEYFIEIFKSNGWDQEDIAYVSKKTNLQDWDLGIVFYGELLEYSEGKEDIITPWIVGKIEVETTDDIKLRSYASFILNELEKLNIHAFHDEDTYKGYFAKETHKGWTELKFYVNMEYPDGYWQNHTL
jgi:hypothetical protein